MSRTFDDEAEMGETLIIRILFETTNKKKEKTKTGRYNLKTKSYNQGKIQKDREDTQKKCPILVHFELTVGKMLSVPEAADIELQ